MVGDAIAVASDHYKVLLENDRVRVLEYRDRPGDKTAMHSHPAVVACPITGSKFKFQSPDGQSMEIEVKAGEPVYMDAVDHSTENIGITDSHVLLIELK